MLNNIDDPNELCGKIMYLFKTTKQSCTKMIKNKFKEAVFKKDWMTNEIFEQMQLRDELHRKSK